MPVEAFVVFAHWSRLGSFSSNRVAPHTFQTQRRAETFHYTSPYSHDLSSRTSALLRPAVILTGSHTFLWPTDKPPPMSTGLCHRSDPHRPQTGLKTALGVSVLTSLLHLFADVLPLGCLPSKGTDVSPPSPWWCIYFIGQALLFSYFPFWLINVFLSLKTPLKCHFFKKAFSVALGRSGSSLYAFITLCFSFVRLPTIKVVMKSFII